MVALRLALLLGVRLMALMGCNTNLEPTTQSCCGCSTAGLTGDASWWLDGRPVDGVSIAVDVVESCRGFLLLLLGTPDLPSGDGGVLVEKMNSVDLFLFSFFFFRTIGFFFLDQTGSRV
jgi:hypothetical protein